LQQFIKKKSTSEDSGGAFKMGEYVLGIDAGTESIRAAVFDVTGKCIGFGISENRTIHRFPGWAEQDPKEWEKSLVEAIRKALDDSSVDPKLIRGVCVDGTSCTVVFIDEKGEPVRPAIMWMDVRAYKEADEISRTGHSALKYSGFSNVSPEWFPCKVLWVKRNEPEIYKKTKTIFEHTDWLIYKLTGNLSLNINTITVRWFYDVEHGGFPRDFYELLGIDDVLEKVPKRIVRLGEVAGKLNKTMAELTGLQEGIPVAEGGADAYIAVIGVNALKPGKIALITGSSHLHIGLTEGETHAPGIFGSYPDALLPGYHVIEGGQISTGSVVKWFKNNFVPSEIEKEAKSSGKNIYHVLDEGASKIPPGSEGLVVLEHWQGNRTPWVDPTSRGVIRGLTLKHTIYHIFRAILEGVAYGTAVILNNFEENGITIQEIVACGGATQSDLWIQIHADVAGKPIILPEESQAACLGSAILAAVGAGIYDSINEAADSMVRIKKIVEPDLSNHEIYRFLISQYIKTYENLKDISREMIDWMDRNSQ